MPAARPRDDERAYFALLVNDDPGARPGIGERAVDVGRPVGDLPVEQHLPGGSDGAGAVRRLADVEGQEGGGPL